MIEPPKFGCSATGLPSSPAVTLTASVSTPEPGLDRQPPGDLLALRRPGDQHRRRRLVRDQRASSSAAGATTYAAKSRRVRRVDLLRAVLRRAGPPPPPRPGPSTPPTASPSRLAAVSSSSVTFLTSPPRRAPRGPVPQPCPSPLSDELPLGEEPGRLAAAVPLVLHDHARPSAAAGRRSPPPTSPRSPARPGRPSTPRSARVRTCTGFFFAAMIPLNVGYRGSLIFSTTDTTAGSDPSPPRTRRR